MKDNKCPCVAGYYDMGKVVCKKCPNNCKECKFKKENNTFAIIIWSSNHSQAATDGLLKISFTKDEIFQKSQNFSIGFNRSSKIEKNFSLAFTPEYLKLRITNYNNWNCWKIIMKKEN